MAGHSHWANIQHKKGAIDAKRGKLWSKLSRAIIIAARNGGGDSTMNLKLRYAIDKAREVSMPKDNIERAIKRGTGEIGGDLDEEVTYEGFGPGGVAILVETLTNNRNRTSSEVRKLFEKGGGHMGSAGCVGYLFERKGLFTVGVTGIREDDLTTIVLESGAEDMVRQGDVFEITCDPTAFTRVLESLQHSQVIVTASELPLLPKTSIDCPDVATGLKVCRLIDALDEHDDVQHVYSNLNMTPELLAELK
ncbi:MAG: YebC/PmpR family DNA-binding transcriptional regulator [Gemmataceae bacterium]